MQIVFEENKNVAKNDSNVFSNHDSWNKQVITNMTSNTQIFKKSSKYKFTVFFSKPVSYKYVIQ